MDLDKLDMTLLRVFHRVMMERKVSTAAEALGLTQPAVSNALKRLRDITKDDLFIRTSGGMQPTTFAIQIAEPVGYALAAIDSTLYIGYRTYSGPCSDIFTDHGQSAGQLA